MLHNKKLIGLWFLVIAAMLLGPVATHFSFTAYGSSAGWQASDSDAPPPPPDDDPPVTAVDSRAQDLAPRPSAPHYWGRPALSSNEDPVKSGASKKEEKPERKSRLPGVDEGLPLVAPSNDDFDNAIVVTALPFSSAIDTTQATTAFDDPVMPCGSASVPQQSNTVWYKVIAANTGRLHADTYNSNYDTVLAIWTGSRGALTNVDCNDDYGSLTSLLDVTIARGQTYYIEVADYGAPGGGLLNLYLAFRPLSASVAWMHQADLPGDRDRLAVVSDGVYIYAIGGEANNGTNYYVADAVQRYDPIFNAWADLAAMPIGYSNIDAAYLNGQIFVPAGYDGNGFVGTHYVYNVGTNSWSTAADAPWSTATITPVLFYSVAADPINNVYYVTGGYNGDTATDELLRYNANTNSWISLAPMQTARYGHEATFMHGLLYVAGGADANGYSTTSAEVYNPSNNSWSYIAPMNVDRLFAANGASVIGAGAPCSGRVLLVDDDWDFGTPGGRGYYAEALTSLGVPYDVWDVVAHGRSPLTNEMAAYQAVIWFTGYAWNNGVFTPSDEGNVAAYLNAGGRLFLSSEDYLYEAHLTSFGQNYLGIQSYVTDTMRSLTVGTLGHPVGNGLGPYQLFAPGFWIENALYTDDVTPAGGATAPFLWQGVGTSNSTAKRTNTYRTIFLAWPLEGVSSITARVDILRASLGWLCEGDGYWYVTGGGFSSQGSFVDTTEVYDPSRNGWSVLDQQLYNLHEARRHFNGAVTEAGAFYVIGGTTADSGANGDYLSTLNERLSVVRQNRLPIVQMQYCSGADPYEPNDSFGGSYLIQSGVDYWGDFACVGDVNDVFRFQMTTSHAIDIWLTNIPAGSNLSLVLYDGQRGRIAYSTNPGNANEHILLSSRPADTYYIQVYNQGNTYSPAVRYRLNAVFQ